MDQSKKEPQAREDAFPSLKQQWKYPYCWIQWKGTLPCMDFYCSCGYHSHIDSDYGCYHIECPRCHQVYEVDGHIRLHLLSFRPEDTRVVDIDADRD